MAPRGIGASGRTVVCRRTRARVNPKFLVAFGFALTGACEFALEPVDLQVSMSSVVAANILPGLGTSFIFVPLTTLAIGTLRNEQIGNATGIQNLVRNVGGSIGLSYVATMQQRYAQVHQALMVGHLSQLNPQYRAKIGRAARGFSSAASPPPTPWPKARGFLYRALLQQSEYWAFVDLFFVVACLCAVCILLIPIFRKPVAVHHVSVAE